MASTDTNPVDQFLSGLPVPVEPAAIERELAALWKPASEASAENPSDAVTRVCLANLLAVGRASDQAWHGRALHNLSARFPCRILWLQLDDSSADDSLHAAVAALCHLPSPGNPQVCSELINLRTGRGGTAAVPGIILPLLESDLPVALWWALPAREQPELFNGLSLLADRIVAHPMPLTSPTLRTADASPCLHLCLRPHAAGKATVLVWHAMSAWRELTAQFFDNPQVRDFMGGISRVCVRYATPTDQPMTTLPAALYAGWLAGQLRWVPGARTAHEEGVRARFNTSAGGTVEVLLRAHETEQFAPGRLMRVDIEAASGSETASFHLQRVMAERMEIRQTLCLTGACTMLKSLPVAEHDEGTLLGAALESQSHVKVFPRAAETALWLLGG